MDDKPNYYAIIPSEVRYDPKLKDKAKLLYGEITALSNKEGYCYASNKYFAELYGVDISTISRLIKNLVDSNYITSKIVYKEGTKEIEKRYLQICNEGYRQFCNGGIGKKVKDNNTSINNTSINNCTTSDDENLFDYLQENGFSLTPIETQIVMEWEDNELTRYAIKQAVLNKVFKIKYVEEILKRYERENIKTLQEAISRDESFKNKNNKIAQEKLPEWFDKNIETTASEEEQKEMEQLIKELQG